LIAALPDCTGEVFHLRHPGGKTIRAECGFDPERGYFVDVVDGGVLVPYDAGSVEYDVDRPLRGALVCLSSFGFVAGADIEDALGLVAVEATGGSSGGTRRAPRLSPGGVRRALRLIRLFREEAGE
jgi:hypothetical protein